MVATVIIVLDEVTAVRFEIAGQVVIFEQVGDLKIWAKAKRSASSPVQPRPIARPTSHVAILDRILASGNSIRRP